MRRGYHSKQSNPVEKIMRPGILALALLIGYGLTYLFSPTPSLSQANAGQSSSAGQTAAIAKTAENGEDYDGNKDQRHRECIYVPAINGYNVIDDQHLTVSTSPKRRYLVTLWNRCRDLKWTHQIAIKSTGSWTCSHSRDMVMTGEQRCMIDDIERVASLEEAKALVKERAESEPDVQD